VIRVARTFFALPIDEKRQIDYHQSPQFRGYMQLGIENTAGQRDEREQIEFGYEEPERPTRPNVPLYERLRGPNQWPKKPPELQSVVTAWLGQMEALSWSLTRSISESLGLRVDALDDLFEIPHVQAKLVHYPPVLTSREDAVAEKDGMGVGAHSDSGFLTLVPQDDVGGLEVLNSEGRWVSAVPMPDSIICNIGEVMQILSGGEYLSTVHRVQRPAAGRISAPYFWNPSLDVLVEPIKSASSCSTGAVPHDGYAVASISERPSENTNRVLPSYGMNALKSLARSHPAILARHHPDLRCLPDGLVVLR